MNIYNFKKENRFRNGAIFLKKAKSKFEMAF